MSRASVAQTVGGTRHRPATVDDLFAAVQSPWSIVSPTGDQVALLVYRNALSGYPVPFDYEGRGMDVMVYAPSTHRVEHVTDGRTTGTSYTEVQWSPDGAMLAIEAVDTRGAAQLVCWRAATGRLEPVGPPGILAYAWISDSTLALVASEPDSGAERIAERGWATQRSGSSPSVSVLAAGPGVEPRLAEAKLFVANSESSAGARTLASFQISPWGRPISNLAVSPDGRALAFAVEAIAPVPSLDERFDQSYNRPIRLALARLDRIAPVRWVQWDSIGRRDTVFDAEGIRDNDPSVPRDRYAWSPDGSAIVAVGYGVPRGAMAVVQSATGASRTVRAIELTIRDVAWPSGREPLVYATRTASRDGGRGDWYRLALDNPRAPRNVSSTLSGDPASIVMASGTPDAYTVADGTLWVLNTETGAKARLTDMALGATSIDWSDASRTTGAHHGAPPNAMVFVLSARGATDVPTRRLRVEVVADAHGSRVISVRDVVGPEPKTGEQEFAPVFSREVVLTRTESRGGTGRVIAGDGRSAWRDTVATFNTHLEQVDVAHRFRIAYRDADGDTLFADITLPVSFEPGRRYPMITCVYPGQRRGSPDTAFDKLNLWAAHGYVVLEPTMPLAGRTRDPGDHWLDVTRGVLPAVDRAVELGYADAHRLGLWGHSMGGYAVYALLTQTGRFKAAVAEAGFADLVSDYGQFGSERYVSSGAPSSTGNYFAEHGQIRLGGPPWSNLWRYWRNSPIAYLDKVETPLLIVQGDLDGVPIEQGEEVFTGLLRLGKRVEFARYWGEAHVFRSPANIRDKWDRELAWFDRYLAGEHSTLPRTVVPTSVVR